MLRTVTLLPVNSWIVLTLLEGGCPIHSPWTKYIPDGIMSISEKKKKKKKKERKKKKKTLPSKVSAQKDTETKISGKLERSIRSVLEAK